MEKNAQNETLNPNVVLEKIPDDWALSTSSDKFDLATFLSTLFDQLMAKEENVKIAQNLAELETVNTNIEERERKCAYLVIREETECLVCRKQLGFKKIRIYPHGEAFHRTCANDPHECPITK
jgi:hypothetical protein